MPPTIAPIQVVIIPIVKKEGGEAVMAATSELATTLRASGYRVKIDDRDLRPGNKYYDWEIKGVPLRLELGQRDLDNGNAFSAKRTGGKEPIPLSDAPTHVKRLLEAVADELRTRSSAHTDDVIKPLTSLENIEDGKISPQK
jgi:prolyl-tRNA synthetase